MNPLRLVLLTALALLFSSDSETLSQDSTAQDSTAQDSAAQGSAVQGSAVQGSTKSVAIVQPPVPAGWLEVPFKETAPEPQLTAAERSRGYMLFQRPITDSVYANSRPQDYERLDVLRAFATPGELEPLTIAIYPIRDLKNMSVQCSDLVHGNERIPASVIDIRLVTYWNIRYPQYNSEGTYRRVPELLEKVDSHSSPQAECQRWWITVHVPETAQPGLYEGTVTVRDDGHVSPVEVPLRFRVMGFTLTRDPNKRLSAYNNPRDPILYRGRDKAFIDVATANEYKSMVEHGLDMLPTFKLDLNPRGGRIFVQHEGEIARMQAAGLKGPLPATGGNAIERIIKLVIPEFESAPHWVLTQDIPPQVYNLIEQKFRDFKAECQQRGLPELICCPLDEVSPASRDFGVQVYAAVKRAGIRTFATKNPLAPDAPAYAPFVDVWCSQPFALPYETVVGDEEHEYWSYPNHNAGELKDRDIMCKGGRMTYGYGFWRSGYTTLIPWHWAWAIEPDALDYLRSSQAGCGQRIDKRGRVIPAIYWECFREGFDDGRYLYTLQQVAWEREGTTDPQCQQLVGFARNGLQQIWDSIEVQDRYLATNMWPSSEFDARRWQAAVLIEQLLQFPATRHGNAPSVYVDNTLHAFPLAVDKDQLDPQNVKVLELASDPSKWRAETDESKLVAKDTRQAGAGPLYWQVSVDHQKGSDDDGDFLLGWPRIRRDFAEGELDLTEYDYLEIVLTFDSNRNEVQDDFTPVGVFFSSYEVPRLYELERDLGGSQRQRTRLLLPIKELIEEGGRGEAPWKAIAYLQLFVAEANYADQVNLSFELHHVRLLRFRQPQVVSVEIPRIVLLPTKNLAVKCEVVGSNTKHAGADLLVARVIDRAGKTVAQSQSPVSAFSTVVLDTSGFSMGDYQLEITTKTGRNLGTSLIRSFRCIDGPTVGK